MLSKKYHFTKMFFLFSLRYILPYLPHKLICWSGEIIGFLSRKNKQSSIVQEELKKLLGNPKSDQELKRIAGKGIGNHKKDLFEIWCFPSLNGSKIKKFAYIDGGHHLDSALSQGKGAVIGVSHFGSWKMIIATLGYFGYPVNQIGLDPGYFIEDNKTQHHNIIMMLEAQSERSLPAKFIYLNREKTLRSAFEALRKNQVVINSFDGFIGKDILEVPFLRGNNKLSTGPIRLAASTGAPLLPTFAVRQRDERYKISIHKPIFIESTKRSSIYRAMDEFKTIFEEYVALYPDHYCRTLYDRKIDPRR